MSSCSSPTSAEERQLKRRKIRKGTTSCWECKRRKTRCQFRSPSCQICISCQRRGTACLSQEYPEHSPPSVNASDLRTEERLMRMEALLERLVERVESRPSTARCEDSDLSRSHVAMGHATDNDVLTPCSMNTPNSGAAPLLYGAVIDYPGQGTADSSTAAASIVPETWRSVSSTESWSCKTLRRKLYGTFPSQRDADLIIAAGKTAAFLQFFTIPYSDLFAGRMRPASNLSALPDPSSHPVLLARTLLYIAIGMQQLHPSNFDLKRLDLGTSPRQAMTECLDTASNFVTSNDRFIGSLEGLECLILEGVYHINAGNLRRAWLLFRRAMGLGQLMGLHRGSTEAMNILDPETRASPAFMWYRIVLVDRYLALTLGLPSGYAENSMFASEEHLQVDCPSGRLERIHCVVCSRIIERNEMPMADEVATTRNIDLCLQMAAKDMPAEWWLLSNASENTGVEDRLEDIIRILVQITHYNLLVLLHLPYMLRTSTDGQYDYSKIAGINSSRELLTRFIRFRSFNQVAFRCRSVDFSAFTGSLTLLLAHLDCHRSNNVMYGFLAHQRVSDRDMVGEVISLMLEVNRLNDDVLTQQTAALLRCLLAIEANALGHATNNSTGNKTEGCCLRLTIPYFGTVNIARDGIIRSNVSIEEGHPAGDTVARSPSHPSLAHTRLIGRIQEQDSLVSTPATFGQSENLRIQCHHQQQQLLSGAEQVHWDDLTPLTSLQTDFFPNAGHTDVNLTAEVEDWALQGVDRVFFENLLRGDAVESDSMRHH